MQASLPQDLVPVGSTTLLFFISASCTVFLSIGQAVFNARLTTDLDKVVPEDVTAKIMSVGATGIRSVVNTEYLDSVLSAYSDAITQIWVMVSELKHVRRVRTDA